MADGDLRDQISRLEVDIEELARTLGGCRKAMLLSKLAIAAGGIWVLAYSIGVIRFDPSYGQHCSRHWGIVVFGSNSSTSKQTTAAMKAAETHRAELIDMIDLREVGASEGGCAGNTHQSFGSSHGNWPIIIVQYRRPERDTADAMPLQPGKRTYLPRDGARPTIERLSSPYLNYRKRHFRL